MTAAVSESTCQLAAHCDWYVDSSSERRLPSHSSPLQVVGSVMDGPEAWRHGRLQAGERVTECKQCQAQVPAAPHSTRLQCQHSALDATLQRHCHVLAARGCSWQTVQSRIAHCVRLSMTRSAPGEEGAEGRCENHSLSALSAVTPHNITKSAEGGKTRAVCDTNSTRLLLYQVHHRLGHLHRSPLSSLTRMTGNQTSHRPAAHRSAPLGSAAHSNSFIRASSLPPPVAPLGQSAVWGWTFVLWPVGCTSASPVSSTKHSSISECCKPRTVANNASATSRRRPTTAAPLTSRSSHSQSDTVSAYCAEVQTTTVQHACCLELACKQ